MLKTIQLHETKPLTTGQISTVQVPPYGKIHSLVLRFSTSAGADVTEAAIRAEIGNIRLSINGKDLVNATATKLLDLYEVLGQNVNDAAGVASVLELNIGRLLYTDPDARDLFGWGMADVQSVQVAVTAGTLSTIANVQAITARTSQNENLGMYMKFINYAVSFNSTGDHTMDTLPRDPDSSYLLVMADAGASGTQTFGEVRVNNVTVKERVPAAVNKMLVSNDRLATPSGYFIYAFSDGSVLTRLPMVDVKDLRFIGTYSVAPGAAGYNLTALTVVNMPANLK
ncbi:MAG: hypothetical protein SFU99_03930 [Saprospiraceae bacterium]|nr:hypothetical protein [Saprospiraceae bacterium]